MERDTVTLAWTLLSSAWNAEAQRAVLDPSAPAKRHCIASRSIHAHHSVLEQRMGSRSLRPWSRARRGPGAPDEPRAPPPLGTPIPKAEPTEVIPWMTRG